MLTPPTSPERFRPGPTPGRTCVGCNQRGASHEMVRLLFGPKTQGEAKLLGVELPGGLSRGPRPPGRGVRVHARQACLDQAVKKGLARGLRRPVRLAAGELPRRLREALSAAVTGGLTAAKRLRCLTPAPTITSERSLGVVAIDTPGASGPAEGRVRVGTKRQLGALIGQQEADELALRHPGLSLRVQQAYALASAAGVGGLEVG